MSSVLEPDEREMRRLLELAVERIVTYIGTLPDQAAYDPDGAHELAALVDEPLPEAGESFESLLALLFDRLIPKGVNTASPGSLSYVTGGGLFHAAVAELIVTATNRYVGYWGGAPGLAEVESRVLRWFNDMVGFPPSAGGVLLTGGSMANLTATVTARAARLTGELAKGTLYASDQMHHSVEKSALVAGLPPDNVRWVPTDEQFRIRPDVLEEMIERDLADGFTPFCLVGTAGTTNTGAIDDLPRLASVARRFGLWLHIDASYGGFFMLTERGQELLRGMEEADSISLDPHKSLFMPFGTGCLLVRDVQMLLRAHRVASDYVATVGALGERIGNANFADLSVEQSREARGLRVWLPLKHLGAGAFREALDEKLDLARFAAQELERISGVELVARPQLSILAFRARADDLDAEALDARTQRIMDIVNHSGPVHLSGTVLDGRLAIRICVLPFRAHAELVTTCIARVRAAVAEASGGSEST
jgi:aromatic-L-amino-acid/L-tryptophan decarboxylase